MLDANNSSQDSLASSEEMYLGTPPDIFAKRIDRLIERIQREPMPPCKGCALYDKCAAQKLACEQFYHYAAIDIRGDKNWQYDTPPTREPTRYLFDLLDMEQGGYAIRPRVQKNAK